jgi:hypothetical protein
MARLASAVAALIVLVFLGVISSAGADQVSTATQPLRTGVLPTAVSDSDFAQIAGLGTSAVVLFVFWSDVAPQAPAPGSDPRDPQNAAYRWGTIDDAVAKAAARGLDVLAVITEAPPWALRPA